MKTDRVLFAMAFVCLSIAILSGCARSPGVMFYTLSPIATSEPSLQTMTAPTVTIAPITLPDLVDRPQMVIRIDAARVDVIETHRWAESLKSGIPRLLAENLSNLLGGAWVSAYPQNAASKADYRVFVDFQRFEAAGDSVIVDALWTIRSSAEGSSKAGRTQTREPNSGEGYDGLISAYNKALLAVSSDIARAIQGNRVVAP